MEGCPFCNDSEVLDREVARNSLAWAFLSNTPIVPRHILVVPVRHVAIFGELTQQECGAIMELVQQLQQALRRHFGAEGFNLAWNEGAIAGQSVAHFHVHIVPRTAGDTGITEYEPRAFLYRPGTRETTPESELRSIASELQNTLKK